MPENDNSEPGTTLDLPRWTTTMLRLLIPAYLVLALAVAAAFYFTGMESDKRTEADNALVVQVAVDSCQDRNFTKEALRDTITVAIESADSGGGDLTQVPGFDDLPEEMQTYLRNLSGGGDDSPSSRTRLRAYRDGLIDEDCGVLRRNLIESLSRT